MIDRQQISIEFETAPFQGNSPQPAITAADAVFLHP